MITVDLVNELYFIFCLKKAENPDCQEEIFFSVKYGDHNIDGKITDSHTLKIYKNEKEIWSENLLSPISSWGLESAVEINKILEEKV